MEEGNHTHSITAVAPPHAAPGGNTISFSPTLYRRLEDFVDLLQCVPHQEGSWREAGQGYSKSPQYLSPRAILPIDCLKQSCFHGGTVLRGELP